MMGGRSYFLKPRAGRLRDERYSVDRVAAQYTLHTRPHTNLFRMQLHPTNCHQPRATNSGFKVDDC